MKKLLLFLMILFTNITAGNDCIICNPSYEITDPKVCEDIMMAVLINYLGIDKNTVKISCNKCKIVMRDRPTLEDLDNKQRELDEFIKDNHLL